MLLPILAVAGNLLLFGAIWGVAKIDPRTPRGNKVLQYTDFKTNAIGDSIGLSGVSFVVFTAITALDWPWYILYAVAGVIAAFVWYKAATKPARARQNIDFWFRADPETGKVQQVYPAGWLHFLYFAVHSGIAMMGVHLFIMGEMGLVWFGVALAFAGVFLTAYIIDIRSGRFS